MEENKHNFEEDSKQEEKVLESKTILKQDAKGFFKSLYTYLKDLLDFRYDIEEKETIEAIKSDIAFRGATAWILICSIFVASIGLNANSTAVVIGAMLISPLMGPILGVGLSLAINDIDTLKKSLINLGTMIALSLLTAYLFFFLFPLSEDNSELLGRVKPDIRDVLIAFFGGSALIIARTKKGTVASVIFGVAIATALMPPLCTAGYGLATANWKFVKGALYLFLINTIFIALATFLVLKLLKFEGKEKTNSKKQKRIAQLASLLAIIVMIPAGVTFWATLLESRFNIDAKSFLDNEISFLENSTYLKKNASILYDRDGTSIIELMTFGTDHISDQSIDILNSRLLTYSSLKNTVLKINQVKSLNNFEYMEQLRSRDSIDIIGHKSKIELLEDKLKRLKKLEKDQIPFLSIMEEIKLHYPEIATVSYSKRLRSDFTDYVDTLSIFQIEWKDSIITNKAIEREQRNLEKWLNYKLKLDTLVIERI